MLHAYLSNLKISYTTEKNSLEREIAGLRTQIRENRELRKNLEQGNANSDYEAFSPRSGNSRNEEKIVELDAERGKLQERLDAAETRRKEYEKKLAELEQALSEEEGRVNVPGQENAKQQPVTVSSLEMPAFSDTLPEESAAVMGRPTPLTDSAEMEWRKFVSNQLKDVLRRTELCTSLMELDSFRCKMELKDIAERMNRILLELQSPLSEAERAVVESVGETESGDR